MTATETVKRFSQDEEEKFILEHTPETGRFLDIGAWHPEELSNTRALYLRGWTGVLIDPSPKAVDALLSVYGHDDRMVIVPAMVGDERTLRELHVSDGPYSTAHQDAADRYSELANFRGKLFVPQFTLEEIIDHWGPFHFVNLDIEGGSVDLLKNLLHIPMQPACICVEHDGRWDEAVFLAQRAGYRLVHANGTNCVFA